MEKKQIPNPKSKLLTNAVVASVGMGLPPVINTPDNMAAIVLFVPIEELHGKSAPEIQDDLGLPWHVEGGGKYWFK